jgi:hypothetical protein
VLCECANPPDDVVGDTADVERGWDCVFLAGIAKGIIPSEKSSDSPTEKLWRVPFELRGDREFPTRYENRPHAASRRRGAPADLRRNHPRKAQPCPFPRLVLRRQRRCQRAIRLLEEAKPFFDRVDQDAVRRSPSASHRARTADRASQPAAGRGADDNGNRPRPLTDLATRTRDTRFLSFSLRSVRIREPWRPKSEYWTALQRCRHVKLDCAAWPLDEAHLVSEPGIVGRHLA